MEKLKKYMWPLAYLLVIAAGIAHIAPSALAGLLSMNVLGITIQQVAGLATFVIGLIGLMGSLKKR